MKLLEANRQLKNSRDTHEEANVSMLVVTSVFSDNGDRVTKLLQKTGIQAKIEQAIAESERVKVYKTDKGLMVSVDDGEKVPYAPKSLDFYLQNVLLLKDKGFYPLYRKILSDLDIVSALSCAHAVLRHELTHPNH